MGVYLYTVRAGSVPVLLPRESAGPTGPLGPATAPQAHPAHPMKFYARMSALDGGFGPEPARMRLVRGQLARTWSGRPLPELVIYGDPKPGASLVRWLSPHTDRDLDLSGAAWYDCNRLHIVGELVKRTERGWTVAVTELPGALDREAQLRESLRNEIPAWRELSGDERDRARTLREQLDAVHEQMREHADQVRQSAGVAA